MTQPLPCPFCGQPPVVEPENPSAEGDAWGQVRCANLDCPVQPVASDGCFMADERGSDAYKEMAVQRWNTRPGG